MKLASDQMEGEEFELNPKNFIAGQEFKATKEVANVGDISNIQLRQADDDSNDLIQMDHSLVKKLLSPKTLRAGNLNAMIF